MKAPGKEVPDRGRASATRSAFIASITSEQVLAGDSEVAIEHDGHIYWLRRTRNNKLILTK
jgi:hemin uptake protein HemP